jgi:O-acetyl-ADP-ribose deacetylase (regulator of RNase III)
MEYISKDITTLQAPALIAQGVNCRNAMGSGVARAIYMQWPTVKAAYHREGSMVLGDIQFVEVEPGLVIANCFTQQHYGTDGQRYASASAVGETLEAAALYGLDTLRVHEVYIPKIGCGLGGLDWEDDVEPLVLDIEAKLPVSFVVCTL